MLKFNHTKYILILMFFLLIPDIKIFAHVKEPFNLLILNSYDPTSEWETSIYQGIQSMLPFGDYKFDIEYLDIRKPTDSNYLNTFTQLLELKYSNRKIDCILAVDDEAFDLMRPLIFNQSSSFYHTPLTFIGINQNIFLTSNETNYITGIFQLDDNLKLLNLILDTHKSIDTINLLCDNTKYSSVIFNNIMSIEKFTLRPIEINYIQDPYIENIINNLQTINNKDSIILLAGEYRAKSTDDHIPLRFTIEELCDFSNYPIYTKYAPYLRYGSIGGTVNVGEFYGKSISSVIIKIAEGIPITDIPIMYKDLDTTVINYDVMNKYNINPFILPTDTFYINKGKFDLLLPKPLKLFVIFISLLTISFIIYAVIKLMFTRKQALLDKITIKDALDRDKFKTELITTISHELRTPLNIIINASNLIKLKLQNKDLLTDEINQKFTYININSQRLLRLINNIIDITKLESGFIEVTAKNKNIVEIIEDTTLSILTFAKSKNIEVIFDTTEEEIITAIDEEKLERIILNLLSNAIKFTMEGGLISVFVLKENNSVIIKIKDNGIGIDETQQANVFNKFHQVDTTLSRSTEGSGLGLYIVNALVQLLNGSILLDSIKDIGTTFTITLPIYLVDESSQKNITPTSTLEELAKLELSDI